MNLLYYTCFQREVFYQAANLSIRSAREHGAFEDDIIVFYDDPMMKDEFLTTEDLNIQCHHVNLDKDFPEKRSNKWSVFAQRHHVLDFIDRSLYTNALYLDCDIIAIKPLQPFFDVQCCTFFPAPTMVWEEINSWAFTEDDWQLAKRPRMGLNSGSYCGPIEQLAEFHAKMFRFTQEYFTERGIVENRAGYDQCFLNKIDLRENLARYPESWVHYPYQFISRCLSSDVNYYREALCYPNDKLDIQDAKLLHFSGLTDDEERLIGTMNHHYTFPDLIEIP